MKKSIIILTLLSLLSLGLAVYEGYLYINSLETLNDLSIEKNEAVSLIGETNEKNVQLEIEYNAKTQDLLKNNIGCKIWANQEETLKKIKK